VLIDPTNPGEKVLESVAVPVLVLWDQDNAVNRHSGPHGANYFARHLNSRSSGKGDYGRDPYARRPADKDRCRIMYFRGEFRCAFPPTLPRPPCPAPAPLLAHALTTRPLPCWPAL
jgi:hypothetical protein